MRQPRLLASCFNNSCHSSQYAGTVQGET